MTKRTRVVMQSHRKGRARKIVQWCSETRRVSPFLIAIAKVETYFGKLPVRSGSIASVVVSTGYLGYHNGRGGWSLMEDVIEQFRYAEWRDLPSSLTVAEVAIVLRLDPDTVYKSIAAGGIPAKRLGRQFRVSRDALISWWASD